MRSCISRMKQHMVGVFDTQQLTLHRICICSEQWNKRATQQIHHTADDAVVCVVVFNDHMTSLLFSSFVLVLVCSSTAASLLTALSCRLSTHWAGRRIKQAHEGAHTKHTFVQQPVSIPYHSTPGLWRCEPLSFKDHLLLHSTSCSAIGSS